LGGLAGSFQVAPGEEIEKFYHFICKGDRAYFELMDQLGLRSRLRWVTTDMGLFYDGSLYTLGDPLSLLAFPHLSIADKARFVMSTMRSKFRGASDWKGIENLPAREWLIEQYGEQTYQMLYEPLLESKFREYAPQISAAWMWSRLHRLGNSRTIAQKERIGYLEGGSQAYIDALEKAIRAQGARVRTSAPVERIVVESGRVAGMHYGGELHPYDAVVSTVPIPHTRQLFAGIVGPYFDNLRQLEYIGVTVMLLRLRHRFSKYFWMNVSDKRFDISGIIEYTNLNPCPSLGGDSILYIPQYLPASHPLYSISNEDLFEMYCGCMKAINPRFDRGAVKQYWVHQDRFAQPICSVGFSKHIPSIQTPIDNLLLTDSYQLHPHDRAISLSSDLGRQAAGLVLKKRAAR